MAHDFSHQCQQRHFGVTPGCIKFYGENLLSGPWHCVCWSLRLIQARECISPNSVLGDFTLIASHGGSICTTKIRKYHNFLLPESQSLNIIQPTAGPGEMKEPEAMALLPSPSVPHGNCSQG